MVWVICLFSYRAKCGTCNGKQLVECALCRGSGVAKKRTRGNAPLNDITATTVLNTKWTAVESQRGQRHFVCVGKTGSGSKGTAQLTSLIGGENFSVTIEELRDKSQWQSGWLTKKEIEEVESPIPCRACAGTGEKKCPDCVEETKKTTRGMNRQGDRGTARSSGSPNYGDREGVNQRRDKGARGGMPRGRDRFLEDGDDEESFFRERRSRGDEAGSRGRGRGSSRGGVSRGERNQFEDEEDDFFWGSDRRGNDFEEGRTSGRGGRRSREQNETGDDLQRGGRASRRTDADDFDVDEDNFFGFSDGADENPRKTQAQNPRGKQTGNSRTRKQTKDSDMDMVDVDRIWEESRSLDALFRDGGMLGDEGDDYFDSDDDNRSSKNKKGKRKDDVDDYNDDESFFSGDKDWL
mmetsp:Transcript_785/g.1932  ORF Transcript_785/g.1932 Transcript_785/m.1932 type:complete len:408 (-) Transcript_785:1264-2487(-)